MNNVKLLTPEEETEIGIRFRKGETAMEMAAFFGVAVRTVYNILDRQGLRRRAMHSLTEGQEKEIVFRYTSGEDVKSISKDFSVSRQTIHNMLKRKGVATNPALARVERIDDAKRAAIVRACQGGATSVAAAAQFGVHQKAVLKFLKLAGVSLPKGRPPAH